MKRYEVRRLRVGDTLEIEDDEEIVGFAEGHGAVREVLVAVPDTPDDHRCGYPIDEDEDRYCTREVAAPEDYCWQHEDRE